ncbi:MAG: hypothetical protein AAF840_04440 [Bacteroidota bacterium]
MKQRIISSGVRHLAATLLFIGAIYPLPGQGDPINFSGRIETVISALDTTPNDYLYFDLSCNMGPWSGYFAPSRWQRTVSNTIVADKPLSVAKGASSTSPRIIFHENRKGAEKWSIEIPAAGYLSFCMQPSTNGTERTIMLMINDQQVDYAVRSDGLYYSPFLQKGDHFSVHIPAGTAVYHWSKLMFHSNFSAVIVRPDAPTPAQRFVPISEGSIQRVFFPDDAPGTWPVFDQDGDRATTYDQTELRTSTDLFEVEYTDNQILNQDTFQLERTFTIREKCSRANWLKRSRIWCTLPIVFSP